MRLVLLIIAGLLVSNAVAAMLFARDTALGMDELLVAAIGVAAGLVVEFGILRRRERDTQ